MTISSRVKPEREREVEVGRLIFMKKRYFASGDSLSGIKTPGESKIVGEFSKDLPRRVK
jgi:hypothetical protein